MPHSVAELQAENVAYELECIDRMYLNCYVPKLSNAAGVAGFIRFHKGRRFASTVDVAEMGKAFVRSIFKFAKQHEIPIHRFAKGERKDDVTQRFLKDFEGEEGVLYIGIAQEKASVPRTIRKRFTDGVIPSLHVYYKKTHLKQYHKTWKKGAALRTETTINDSYDFAVGRLIGNLPKLRHIGFAANRRVLEVETISHDNRVGAQAFDLLQSPAVTAEGQRASALRFGDRRVQALFAVLVLLSLKIEGFRNRQLRPLLAQMLGLEEAEITQGKMSYDLRRLRLHGLIERIEKSHRYRVTKKGLAAVHFYHRLYTRLLRPALSVVEGGPGPHPTPEEKPLQQLHSAMDRFIREQAA